MSGQSIFAQVRTSVDKFFEDLLAEVPHHVNPNLRVNEVVATFWSKGNDNNGNPIPAVGLQVELAVYPGTVVGGIPQQSFAYAGGQLQTMQTGGSTVTAPDPSVQPLWVIDATTDGNGMAVFTIPGPLSTDTAYWLRFGDNWPGGADDTAINAAGLLPQAQSDWGGAIGPGFVYGFVTGALPPASGSPGPGSGPSGTGPTHHQRGT